MLKFWEETVRGLNSFSPVFLEFWFGGCNKMSEFLLYAACLDVFLNCAQVWYYAFILDSIAV